MKNQRCILWAARTYLVSAPRISAWELPNLVWMAVCAATNLAIGIRSPVNRDLGLVAPFIKMLSEIALTIQKCHAYHGYTQVGDGSQSVSSQYP
jgi:predicted membrane protein